MSERLQELKEAIKSKLGTHWECFNTEGSIIVEEYYEATGYEKNSDDCCDVAQENGEEITKMFPELEVEDYYCHRFKYAIVELKLKK